MTTWWALRLMKFLALGLFAAGVHGAVSHADAAARRRAAFTLATPGFVLLWLAGYGMMKATGGSLSAPSVLVAIVGSIGALHAALGSATRAAVRPVSRVLAFGGMNLAIAAMVVRDGGAAAWGSAVLAALVATALLVRASPLPPADSADPAPETAAWFRTVAHLEGASLLFMLGLMLPLRAATGVSLDGGTGMIGWFHGTLVFVYISGLIVSRRVLGWSLAHAVQGFVAGLLPFGTFWFVRKRM